MPTTVLTTVLIAVLIDMRFEIIKSKMCTYDVKISVPLTGPCGLAETENRKRSRVIGADRMVNFIMVYRKNRRL